MLMRRCCRLAAIACPVAWALSLGILTADAASNPWYVMSSRPVFANDAANSVVIKTLTLMANETTAGIMAGFHRVNSLGGVRSRPLTLLLAVDNVSADFVDRIPMMCAEIKAAMVAHPTSFIMPTLSNPWTSQVLTAAAVASNISSFMPGILHSTLDEEDDYFIHLRPQFELVPLLQFAMHGHPQCAHFAVIAYSFLRQRVEEGMADARRRFGVRGSRVKYVELSSDETKTEELVRWKETASFVLDGAPVEECVLLMLTGSDVVGTMQLALKQLGPEHWERINWIASSLSSMPRWQPPDAPGMANLFVNLHQIQVMPHPEDTRYDIVKDFHADLKALRVAAAAGPPDMPPEIAVPLTQVTPSYQPNYLALEGYMAGLAIAEAMRRVPADLPMTGVAVNDAVLRTRLLDVADVSLGLFSRSCSGARTSASGPCECRIGTRAYFVTRVNTSTRFMAPVDEAAATYRVSLTECHPSTKALRPSYQIVVPDFGPADPGLQQWTRDIVQGMTDEVQLLESIQFEGDLNIGSIHVVHVDARKAAAGGRAAMADFARGLRARYRPLAFVGAAPPEATPMDPFMQPSTDANAALELAPLASAFPDTDMPWDLGRTGLTGTSAFFPTIADLLSACALYAEDFALRRTAVLCDTDAMCDLGRRAANTYGLRPTLLVAPPGEAASVARWLRGVLDDENAVMVATRRESVALGAILAASRWRSGTDRRMMLAADETVAADALWKAFRERVDLSTVLVASGLNHHKSATSSAAHKAGNPLVASRVVRTAYGAAVAEMIVTASSWREAGDITPEAALKGLFLRQEVSLSAAFVGPYDESTCDDFSGTGADRSAWPRPEPELHGTCQCAKGIRAFNIIPAAELAASWLSNVPPPIAYTYFHKYCGPDFQSLPAVNGTSVGVVAAAAASAGLLAIGSFTFLIVAFIMCKGLRNNKRAPKDGSRPFAVVFTDVQSSTMLWARAPLEMGPALEVHHDIMRKLIKEHRGYEVKTIGDAFMVAFTSPADAVRFAVGVQQRFLDHDWGTSLFDDVYLNQLAILRSTVPGATSMSSPVQEINLAVLGCLASDPPPSCLSKTADVFSVLSATPEQYRKLWNGIRVRVGVHYGCGEITYDNSSKGFDYYGTVVNTAARVESVAHGGQVLVTQAALQAAVAEAPALGAAGGELEVLGLGRQALRGLDEPVELLQVLLHGPMTKRRFPPLRLDCEPPHATNHDSLGQSPPDKSPAQLRTPLPRPLESSSSGDGVHRRLAARPSLTGPLAACPSLSGASLAGRSQTGRSPTAPIDVARSHMVASGMQPTVEPHSRPRVTRDRHAVELAGAVLRTLLAAAPTDAARDGVLQPAMAWFGVRRAMEKSGAGWSRREAETDVLMSKLTAAVVRAMEDDRPMTSFVRQQPCLPGALSGSAMPMMEVLQVTSVAREAAAVGYSDSA